MAKETANAANSAGLGNYQTAIASSTITPLWAQALTAGSAGSPNVMWQGTSSGATYCSASSVLKP